ncbi:MAG: alpha/beta fold hydrolase, partial [Burkholderiaceae bacterium]|nr:alpha/beta fold hydrolase [Burkholderiaceae bacterium]
METKPFTIAVPDAAIDDLAARLRMTRWPMAAADAATSWTSGTNPEFMRELIAHWRERYDWRRAERELNALPHFLATIAGHAVHYLHIRGKGKRNLPLIITHGWPGSFLEPLALIPYLTQPGAAGLESEDAFDLIIPSLPGFGFSPMPQDTVLNTKSIAALWHDLMLGLGYDSYYVQGGDIGAGVSTWMARLYPDAVAGMHLNFIPGSYQPHVGPPSAPLSPEEQTWHSTRAKWLDEEGGYSHQQSTKPLTLSYALSDSPAGLAAWIVEKFHSWSDCNGDLSSVFNLDELLTNLSLYWFSGSVAATLAIYRA